MPHCTCGCGCKELAVPESNELQLCADCLERRIFVEGLKLIAEKEGFRNPAAVPSRLIQVARISCESNPLAAQFIFQHSTFSVLHSVS